MNIDLLVVIVVTIGLVAMGWYTKRYMRNATDFLAANRCAGRYMMSVAMGTTWPMNPATVKRRLNASK